MKRPWTPGPWLQNGSHLYDSEKNLIAQFSSIGEWKHPNFVDLEFNLNLILKSPEMAELLIELSEMRVGGEVYWEEQIELINQAKKLLSEVGYEPL